MYECINDKVSTIITIVLIVLTINYSITSINYKLLILW